MYTLVHRLLVDKFLKYLPLPLKLVTVIHGSFYETARTCSEPRSVERRLSFTVEVTTASGNWAPASLENHF